ncbi:MBOAT family O-acyltransferase [Clostridium sp. BJN0001]|uniref:MBOAT family O-acyltransferase n=1 Tax=Clostridium sp. BJN0001 TaxID=2930219 RepID=UPI001FD0EB06|nr:MBOAT family O-acyltransferase [Clostridium sp. BJN0001]
MVFSNSIFMFVLLPITILGYYIIPQKFISFRNLFIFIVSLLFYAWGEPVYVSIIILSIIMNYFYAILVENNEKNKKIQKFVIIIMLTSNLGILFLFKYLKFFISNINAVLGSNITEPQISLPIGISFFTFQAISYVIDVYRSKVVDGNKIKAQRNIINLGLYIAFFPQLIAGPIVRYNTIAAQIKHRIHSTDKFGQGVKRFIVGVSKKVILADNLGLLADKAFTMLADQGTIPGSFAWLGAVAYTMQIFFDFSGYSDMAIGLGKMFGFEFMENFNYPYISKTATEFWRRWHISLGNWFKDYVYIPLGGNKKGLKRTIINSFVVWAFTGIWHGAAWNFIFWGLYYFVLISIEKIIKNYTRNIKIPVFFNAFKHIYLIIAVVFGWVLFRAPNLTDAVKYIESMIGVNSNCFFDSTTLWFIYTNKYFLIAAILFSIPIVPFITNRFKILSSKIENNKMFDWLYSMGYSFSYMILLIVNISYIIKSTYSPFIYFNF